MSEQLLSDLREIKTDLEAISEAMQSAERPGTEDCGIAFVSAEHALEIVNRLELDLLTDLVTRNA